MPRLEVTAGRRGGHGPRPDVLIVGAGFAGSVSARRLAEEHGLRVLVIDRRPHIGGNAYDTVDEHGVLVHTYGPHIFHTNAEKVVEFLSRFMEWRPYEHRVVAEVDGRFVPMPINRRTVQALHGVELADEEDTAAYLGSLAEPREAMHTSEDSVVAKVGRDLYERLFRGYTRKQWALHESRCSRLPRAPSPGSLPGRADALAADRGHPRHQQRQPAGAHRGHRAHRPPLERHVRAQPRAGARRGHDPLRPRGVQGCHRRGHHAARDARAVRGRPARPRHAL